MGYRIYAQQLDGERLAKSFRDRTVSDAEGKQFNQRSIAKIRLFPVAEGCNIPLDCRVQVAPLPAAGTHIGVVIHMAAGDRLISAL